MNQLKSASMEIKSLSQIPFDQIYEAFSQAFVDYEMQLSKQQLQSMLNRRGFVPELSVAAFDKGSIVAFTFNGIGNFKERPTAYDTGTGTIKAFRGQGLATKLFKHAIPILKATGIEQYLLEVLQHNSPAVSVYQKLGFEISREFNYFIQERKQVNLKRPASDTSYRIQPISLATCRQLSKFGDVSPSWQNTFDAIERKPDDFKIFAAQLNQKIVGYCILEVRSGDLSQFAVAKNHRRKGVGSLLFQEALNWNQNDSIKIINAEVSCDSLTRFLKSKNMLVTGKQFEMIRQL